MTGSHPLTLHGHDAATEALPADGVQAVDDGIGEFNDAAAPLHEVVALAVFARDAAGRPVGGAVGRRWGTAVELQQLWLPAELRGQGRGRELLRAFEDQARAAGCTTAFLETFSFQAPEFYERCGWTREHANRAFPHGIVKWTMQRRL
jgi:GNAT superfamily N-acetyltransferase